MQETVHVYANNYLRNLHSEIYKLNNNQTSEDFLNFFIKDDVFSIDLICKDKGQIELYINESFHFYDLRSTESVILITNNHLLLKTEQQRRRYINKCVDYINNLVSDKHKRKSIPKKVKNDLWINYFGQQNATGKCYVCRSEIHITKFEAGHVVPDSMGGLPTVENLRPICGGCNKAIGKENLYSFKVRYYPDNK